MRDGKVEDSEKGLSFFTSSPVCFSGRRIPDSSHFLKVVVLLAVVGAIVTGVPEVLGIHLHIGWKPRLTSHVFGSG